MAFDKKNLISSVFSPDRLQDVVIEMDVGNVARFSRNADIPRTTVQSWLQGKASPKREYLLKLINYTEKPERYFYPDSVSKSAITSRSGIDFTKTERDLIEAMRVIDPDKAQGLYGMAKIQLEIALKDKEIKKNKRKKELLERAINSLDKAINEF